MPVSLIISYHNETQSFLSECLLSLRESLSITLHEIIIVDDKSDIPLQPIDGVTILRQPIRSGVGASFDLGVRHAKYENIFLMACDIRFAKNGWDVRLLEEIEKHPKSLICTRCIGLNRLSRCCNMIIHDGQCIQCHKPALDNMDLEYRRTKSNNRGGATILMFHDKLSEPHKPASFRNIIECKWLPVTNETESYEVPAILGACYGTTKSWYNYIDGFWGHRTWGSLESYISLKSWLFGGSCRFLPTAETGHIFKTQKDSPHKILPEDILYNKLLVATLLLPDPERYIAFLGSDRNLDKAKKLFALNQPIALKKREEYKAKTCLSLEDYCAKFSINLRK